MRFDEILGLVPRLSFALAGFAGLQLFAFELCFWATVILFTFGFVRFRPTLIENAEAHLREVSQFERFWLIAFAVGVIGIRLSLLPLLPVPSPSIHDESSYILAADTFAHGRLTNPPSPMWQHFESFHINVLPSYQSMYPPAQGLALAVGQKLTGSPWVGVVLSTGLMCGAIYWMVLGWLPAPWAWLGGAYASVRYGIFSYWMNTYFGGSVAALGGALALGALPRFRQKPTARIGMVLATGLLIMANSRPLEGLLFSIPILVSVLVILIRSGKVDLRRTIRAALPAAALLCAGAGWMMYYNWRSTGNALLMPYAINFKDYHISKPYFFQKPNPIPEYRHASMRALYVYHELPDVMIAKYNLAALVYKRIKVYYAFFLWPFLLLVVPCVVALWRSHLRVVLISIGIVAINQIAQIWDPRPHYAAPAAGAILLAALFSLRYLRNSHAEYSLWGSRAFAVALALTLLSPIADKIRDPFMIDPIVFNPETPEIKAAKIRLVDLKAWPIPREFEHDRIAAQLRALPGKHLILVHYPPYDIPNDEWVYNDADIDHSKIVWARDMGERRNKELVDYYSDRQIWYVDHGEFLPRVLPYDQAIAQLKLPCDVPPSQIALPAVSNALHGLTYNAELEPKGTRPRFASVSR